MFDHDGLPGRPYSAKLPSWRTTLTLWCLDSYLPAHAGGIRHRGASHMRCPKASERRHERSVCHEHRQFRVVENVAGGAAKDHLPQSALGVGALDQEVATQRLRVGQNRLTRHAAIKTYGQRFCRHPVQLQIAAQLLPRAPVLGFSLVARATHSLADIDNSAPTTAPTMYMA